MVVHPHAEKGAAMFRIAAAVALVAVGSPVRADDAEEKAVKHIEKLGGKVMRDDKQSGNPVTYVSLSKTPATDDDMKQLASLTHLTHLSLSGTKVGDKGLKELAPLTGII